MPKKALLWTGWSAVSLAMITCLTFRLRGPDRTVFLPGETSHGHYQIELDCHACHTPWMGVKEQACYDCHGEELRAVNDTHPKSKFTDPRNADRLKHLRADNCVTCHREHAPEQTLVMGVTVPLDYCYHCHQETPADRPSHKDFPFDSCATAGCHNYHDNTMLYEDFLLGHLNQPDRLEDARVARRDPLAWRTKSGAAQSHTVLDERDHDAPASVNASLDLVRDWATTGHAKAGVNCSDCHVAGDRITETQHWSDRLNHTVCVGCHEREATGFLAGRHGMRTARNLSPMRPSMARLPMKSSAAHRELSCTACHGAHAFDTRKAAVESCMACHDDAHTLAYRDSTHHALWQAELDGTLPPGSGVSCATCHLPREKHAEGSTTRVVVQHNQNANLRPNEKMLRTVCLDCHGLGFALDALADPALVRANFRGRPSRPIESLDLAERRRRELRKTNHRKLETP